MEIPIVLYLPCDHIKQSCQVLILHILALGMKVEPHKPESWITNSRMHSLKILSHSFLSAFLID